MRVRPHTSGDVLPPSPIIPLQRTQNRVRHFCCRLKNVNTSATLENRQTGGLLALEPVFFMGVEKMKRILIVIPAKHTGGVEFGVYTPEPELQLARGRKGVEEVRELRTLMTPVWERGAKSASQAMLTVWEAHDRNKITELEARMLQEALGSWDMEHDTARVRFVMHRKPVPPPRASKKNEPSAEADVRPKVLPMGDYLEMTRARQRHYAGVRRHPDARG